MPRLSVRLTTVLAVGVVALAVPEVTWADADPASDFLPLRDSYLPSNAAGPAQRQLDRLLKVARARGHPFKVAVIATPTDLGAITSLFNQPQAYAKFLHGEIAGFVHGPAATLVVIMPGGVGLVGPDAAAGHKIDVATPSASDAAPARLTDTAIETVEKVAAAAGQPLPHVRLAAPTPTASPDPGHGAFVWLAVAALVFSVIGLVALGHVLRRALTSR